MKTIGSFRKNIKEKVMLNLQEYKQVKVLDFRVYYEDEDGRYHPSTKGLTLGLDHYFELRRIVLKARKHVLKELEIPEETNVKQLEIEDF